MTLKREEFREEIESLMCINSGDTIPNCGECIYFNSVSQYPCNNPILDQILEAHNAVIKEIFREIENKMELEQCDPEVMAYFTPYYAVLPEDWQALMQKYGGKWWEIRHQS